MKDGLWVVTTKYLCAGFVVVKGKVDQKQCAPILKHQIAYWRSVAKWVCA